MRYLLLSMMLIAASLMAAATWQTFTNTDHVFDLELSGTDFYYSSWGGVLKQKYSGGTLQAEAEVINSGNGLVSNDIRCLEYIGFSESLWMGSSDQGVMIKSPAGMQQITTELGLPSPKVNRIIEHESTILVATPGGLAVFYYLEDVNFPLMLHQYTYENTGGGLLANNILDMVLASDNRLYLLTSAGVCYVPLADIDNDDAWHSLDNPRLGLISQVAVNDGYIAVADWDTVYRRPLTSIGSWDSFGTAQGLSGDRILSLALDADNSLWIAYGNWDEEILSVSTTKDTLLTRISINGEVQSWEKNTAGLGNAPINRFEIVSDTMFMASWGEGIYIKQGDIWINEQANSIGFPKITQIATDENYASWYASGNWGPDPVRKGTMGVTKYLGGIWQTYDITNSPIHTDNVLTVAVDSQNRKWFGTWDAYNSPEGWTNGLTIYNDANGKWLYQGFFGLRHWNQETQEWGPYDANGTRLLGGTIGGIYPGKDDEMIVFSVNRGVNILDGDNKVISTFSLPNSIEQFGIFAHYNGSQYFFGSYNEGGLTIWNHDSHPVTGGIYWITPPINDLRNCVIYGVISVDTPYEGRQHWIAASTGLFMWDESDWYRYDTMIKRFKFNPNTSQWDNNILYYVDEERLFGSVRTTPTAIYLDPFNRIWIGSLDNGLSMYNPETERFTNYFKPNYPLLSNFITSLGYDPLMGNLLIGTTDGLNTLKIGRTVKPFTTLNNVKAFPNPFEPAKHSSIQIINLPDDSMPFGKGTCRIYDASGALVIKLEENEFSRFAWNGLSESGKQCSSGIYFFVVADADGNSKKGKFALVR